MATIERMEMEKGFLMRNELSDMFYPMDCWPTSILRILSDKNFKRQDRLGLASFFHGNGCMDKFFFAKLVKFHNPFFTVNELWRKRISEFKYLWNPLDNIRNGGNGEQQERYYYYNLMTQHMMFYNGN